jgi:hypothetical protein
MLFVIFKFLNILILKYLVLIAENSLKRVTDGVANVAFLVLNSSSN